MRCEATSESSLLQTASGSRSRTLAVRRTVLITFSVFTVLAAAAALDHGPEYEVRGIAECTIRVPTGEVSSPRVNFTASVRGSCWAITLIRAGTNGVDYEQATYDGANLYYLTSMQSSLKTRQFSMPGRAGNIANALVANKGEVFHYATSPEIGPIWLACASSAFFRNLTTNFMEPPVPFDGTGRNYDGDQCRSLPITSERFADSLGLPLRTAFYDDGTSVFGNKFPPPYSNGFTNSIYHVDSWTNQGGLHIPISSQLSLYRPRENGSNANDLSLICTYALSINDFRIGTSNFSCTPILPGVTAVFDSRLKEVPNLLYLTTNKWPTASEIRSNPVFRDAVHYTDRDPSQKKKGTLAMLVLLASMSLPAFLVIIYYQCCAKKTQNNNTQTQL